MLGFIFSTTAEEGRGRILNKLQEVVGMNCLHFLYNDVVVGLDDEDVADCEALHCVEGGTVDKLRVEQYWHCVVAIQQLAMFTLVLDEGVADRVVLFDEGVRLKWEVSFEDSEERIYVSMDL